MLHLYISDVSLTDRSLSESSSSISTKPAESLKLHIVYENEFKEFGTTSREFLGKGLYKFNQTVPIPIRHMKDVNLKHYLHFKLFSTISNNDDLQRLGTGQLGVSVTDDILTKTVVFHDDVNQEIIGRASITVFFNKSKITIGENALVQEVTVDPKKKEKEYAFLLSRRLRRTHTPYTPVTSDPILDHKISMDTEWYVQQKLKRPNTLHSSKTTDTMATTSKRKSSSSSTTKRSTSAPVRRTNRAEPPPAPMSVYHPASSSALFSTSTSRRATCKTPNRERPVVVPIVTGPPKLRKTCMSVGYVHNTWPELDTAEYEKKMYQLQLANERKMELLKAIDEQIKHREEQHKRQQQLAHAPPPVKEFVHMTEVEMREHQLKEAKTRQLQQEVLQREAEIKDLQTLFNRLRIETALTSVTIGNHPTYYDPHLPLSQSTSAFHVQPHPVLTQSILSTQDIQHPKSQSEKVERPATTKLVEATEKKGTKKKKTEESSIKVKKESHKVKHAQVTEDITLNHHRKPPVDTGDHNAKLNKKSSKKTKKNKAAPFSKSDKVDMVFANTYDNHNLPATNMTYLQPSLEKNLDKKQSNFQPMPSLSRTEALLAQQEQETSGRLSLEDILTPQEQQQKAIRSKTVQKTTKKKVNGAHSQVESLLSSSPLFKSHNLHRDMERVQKLEASVLSSTSQKQQAQTSIPHSESKVKKSKDKTAGSSSKSKASRDHLQASSITQSILLPATSPAPISEKKVKTKIALKRQKQEKELVTKRKTAASSSKSMNDDHGMDLPEYLEDMEAEDERLEKQFDERKQDPFFQRRSHYLSRSLDSPNVDPRHNVHDASDDSDSDSADSYESNEHHNFTSSRISQNERLNPDVPKQDIVSKTQNFEQKPSVVPTNASSNFSPMQRNRALDRIAKNQLYNTASTAPTTTTSTAIVSSDAKMLSLDKPAESMIEAAKKEFEESDSDDTVDRSTGYRPVSTPPLGHKESRVDDLSSNINNNNSNNCFVESNKIVSQNEATTPQKVRPFPPPLPSAAVTPGKDTTTKASNGADDTLLSPKTLFYKNQLLKRMEEKDSSGGQTPIAGANSPGMDSFTRANITISAKPSSADNVEKQALKKETKEVDNDVRDGEEVASAAMETKFPVAAVPPIEDYDQTVKKMRMLMPVIGKDLQSTIVSQFEKNRRYDNHSISNANNNNNLSLSASSSSIAPLTAASLTAVETKEPVSITPPPKQSIASTFSAKRERQEYVQQRKKNQTNELRQSGESEISKTSHGTSSSAGSNRKKVGNKKHSLAASWSSAQDSPRTWSLKQRQQQPLIKSSSDVKGQMNTEWQKIYDAIAAVEKKVKKTTSTTGVSHVQQKAKISTEHNHSLTKKGTTKTKSKVTTADNKLKIDSVKSLESDAKHTSPSRSHIDAKSSSFRGSKDTADSDRDIAIEQERKLKMASSDDKGTSKNELADAKHMMELKRDTDEYKKTDLTDNEEEVFAHDAEIDDGVDLNQTRVLHSSLPLASSPLLPGKLKPSPTATFLTSPANEDDDDDSSMPMVNNDSEEEDDDDDDGDDNGHHSGSENAEDDSLNHDGGEFEEDESDEDDEDEDDRAFAALQREFNEQFSD